MYDLAGKAALVTGAGGRHGIGRAIALRLAREGADVAVTDLDRGPGAFRPEDVAAGWRGVESVAEEIRALGRGALALHGDVAEAAHVEAAVAAVLARFGRLDILVANAAATPGPDRVPVVDLEEAAFDAVMRVNVKGTFLCARAAARHMVARGGGGRILILSSCLGKQGRARYAAYSASKAALIGFTQALALELGPHGITVNALCPGPVDTERFDRVADFAAPEGVAPADFRASLLAERAGETPLGRVAVAEDVARSAAFLASGEGGYLTGLALSVAGGFEMR